MGKATGIVEVYGLVAAFVAFFGNFGSQRAGGLGQDYLYSPRANLGYQNDGSNAQY